MRRPTNVGAAGSAGRQGRSRPSLRTVFKYVFGVVAIVLLIGAVWSQRDAFLAAASRLSVMTVLLSFGFGALAAFLNAMSWRSTYCALGIELPIPVALRVFLVSQIGKYVPGSVWPILTQAEMARERGISGSRAGTASIISMLIGVVTAAVASVALLFSQGVEVLRDYWYVFAVIPLGFVLLVPAVLSRLLSTVGRLIHRPMDLDGLGGRGLLHATLWAMGMWCAFGLHTWVILRDLLPDSEVGFSASVGAFALAWAAGFLVVIAPAGVGIREAALVVALGGILGRSEALAFAVFSRVILTVVDTVGAGVGLVVGRARSGPGVNSAED